MQVIGIAVTVFYETGTNSASLCSMVHSVNGIDVIN